MTPAFPHLPLRIAGVGKFLPPRIVSAEEIDKRAGMASGWTLKHTGVAQRHYVDGETASEMAAHALKEALAGVSGPVELLISAGGAPQQLIPCTAALVAKEMGWQAVPCMDVNATCLGFLAAMDVAAQFIATGRYQRIAIVCADIASKGLNWAQPEAAGLMGDGAAAVIVERSSAAQGSAVLAAKFETWPEGSRLTAIRGGGSALPAHQYDAAVNDAEFRFHMDGPGIFKLAATKIQPFVDSLLGKYSWRDIDVVIPHQGSLTAMRLLRKRLRIPEEKLVETAQTTGNTISAASLCCFSAPQPVFRWAEC
jgi:3-oxoacyl-[acyl-carrier-protein] synthase III